MNNNYLCEEVVSNILARLPAKSLVRFMAVCKSWKSIITSLEFGLLVSKSPPKLLVHTDRECYTLLEDVEKGNNNSLMFVADFPLKHSGVKCVLLGSDNGLLCVGIKPPINVMCHRVFLWNPFVQRHALIPNHPLVDHDTEYCYGFGATINDYKYVRIVGFRDSVDEYCYTQAIETYSMKSGTWRPRKYLDYEMYVNKEFRYAAVVLRGKLHWLGRDDSIGTNILASFELEDEVFEEFVLPECLAIHKFYMRCVVINESLALIAYGGEGRHSTVWVMGEYGDVNSWSKLYDIDATMGNFERVVIEMIHVLKNDELLLGLKPFGRRGEYGVHPLKLVTYNPTTRKTSDFAGDGVLTPSPHGVFVFSNYCKESLALLGDHRAVADREVLSVSQQTLIQHYNHGHYHWYPLLHELDKWEKSM